MDGENRTKPGFLERLKDLVDVLRAECADEDAILDRLRGDLCKVDGDCCGIQAKPPECLETYLSEAEVLAGVIRARTKELYGLL